MTPDYEAAALAATKVLTNYSICSAPVDPVRILKTIPNVMLVSYAEVALRMGIDRDNAVVIFGDRNQDAATSVVRDGDSLQYFVTYNQRLPFYLLQRALARELGHIIMGHDGSRPDDVRTEEAMVFARYLLCPRPLIHALREAGVRLTVETLGTITGCYERCLAGMRRTPGIRIPAIANRMVRTQFDEYIHDFLRFQPILQEDDESALADFGTFMENYEE